MKINEKCENCGRHPFCEYQEKCVLSKFYNPNNNGKKYWIKRERELKLTDIKNKNFNFEVIE